MLLKAAAGVGVGLVDEDKTAGIGLTADAEGVTVVEEEDEDIVATVTTGVPLEALTEPPAAVDIKGVPAAAGVLADKVLLAGAGIGGGPAEGAGTLADEKPPVEVDVGGGPAAADPGVGGTGKLEPSSTLPIGSSGVSSRLPSSHRGI